MAGGLYLRSMMLLLLIICFAGQRADGFRKPKNFRVRTSADVAMLAAGNRSSLTRQAVRCLGAQVYNTRCGDLCCSVTEKTDSKNKYIADENCIDTVPDRRRRGSRRRRHNMKAWDMCGSGPPICSTDRQTSCLVAPNCPPNKIAVHSGGGLSCRSFSVQGLWQAKKTISQSANYSYNYGFSGKKTTFDYGYVYDAVQSAASAGFSFGGFGASAAVSTQNSEFAAAAAFSDMNSNFNMSGSQYFINSDGKFLYFWQWIVKITGAEDIVITSPAWVQSDAPPACFPAGNDDGGKYTKCLKGRCLPGMEVKGGCQDAGLVACELSKTDCPIRHHQDNGYCLNIVKFGLDNRWVKKPMYGEFKCNTATFGGQDPYRGKPKVCICTEEEVPPCDTTRTVVGTLDTSLSTSAKYRHLVAFKHTDSKSPHLWIFAVQVEGTGGRRRRPRVVMIGVEICGQLEVESAPRIAKFARDSTVPFEQHAIVSAWNRGVGQQEATRGYRLGSMEICEYDCAPKCDSTKTVRGTMGPSAELSHYRNLVAFKHTSIPHLWIFAAHNGLAGARGKLEMIGVETCGKDEDAPRIARSVTAQNSSFTDSSITAFWNNGVHVTYPMAVQDPGYRLGSIEICDHDCIVDSACNLTVTVLGTMGPSAEMSVYRNLVAFTHTSIPNLWIFAAQSGDLAGAPSDEKLLMIGVEICGGDEMGPRIARHVARNISSLPLDRHDVSAAWEAGVDVAYADSQDQKGYRLGSIEICDYDCAPQCDYTETIRGTMGPSESMPVYRNLVATKHTNIPDLWIFTAHQNSAEDDEGGIFMMIGVENCGKKEVENRIARRARESDPVFRPLDISAAWNTGVNVAYARTLDQRGYRLGSIEICENDCAPKCDSTEMVRGVMGPSAEMSVYWDQFAFQHTEIPHLWIFAALDELGGPLMMIGVQICDDSEEAPRTAKYYDDRNIPMNKRAITAAWNTGEAKEYTDSSKGDGYHLSGIQICDYDCTYDD